MVSNPMTPKITPTIQIHSVSLAAPLAISTINARNQMIVPAVTIGMARFMGLVYFLTCWQKGCPVSSGGIGKVGCGNVGN